MEIVRIALLDDGGIRACANRTDYIGVYVPCKNFFNHVGRELSIEHSGTAFKIACSSQLTCNVLQDFFAGAVEDIKYLLKVLPDAPVTLNHELHVGNLEPLT